MIVNFLNIISIVFSFMNIGQAGDTISISEDLEIIPLTKHCYRHVSYWDTKEYSRVAANGLIYQSGDSVIIIDTPWNDNQTLKLLNWIRNSLKADTKAVIVTHWHADCMGGLQEVHKSGINSYALDQTAEIAKSKQLPAPEFLFSDSLVISLNHKPVKMMYFGGGHTKDNIVVWLPDEKVLFVGCMVKTMNWNTLGFTSDADLESWPHTIEKVLKYFPDDLIIVPGHGEPGGKGLLRHTLTLFQQ